jgi:hypothetical protein
MMPGPPFARGTEDFWINLDGSIPLNREWTWASKNEGRFGARRLDAAFDDEGRLVTIETAVQPADSR